ncbi:SixA phosphatase family protein [Tranquillimonas alkanivorans]|uniref:Phosphohistidine phosphatase n=1 Tax=Tranquillimonas alkanivorans TaxID=441119 RepID=A0A1I5SXV0_9RHOB|nr:histidine phosphatase family protein [Tranquillimonas alkanivorans]SFP75481.1 phosphohistidine phosphatase [Tranquillimonas alkanivorans]
MTLRLILIRHGKSSWDDPKLDDHARPLNPRGRRSAHAIGTWMAEKGYIPGEMFCSDARRAVGTAKRVLEELPDHTVPHYLPALFHASAETILAAVRGASAPVLAVVGHNPGIGAFASRVLSEPWDHPRFGDYPTCATTVIDFDAAQWRGVEWGSGRAVDFALPRELLGE